MIKLTTHKVFIDGYQVSYQSAGAGEPVVLVHGLSGSGLWWRHNVSILAQYYQVYLVDLPGFGAMSRYRHRFVLKDMADWLFAWLQAVGLSSAHFIGHSMGGYICMRLAASYPQVVKRLVLVSPAARSYNQSVIQYARPLFSGTRYASLDFLFILSWDALRSGPITLLRATRDLVLLNAEDDIKKVTAPTLLIWGEGDTLVPLTLAHVLRGEMQQASLLILKRAGHVSMFENAPEFNRAVLAFLAGEQVGT